CQQYDNFSF
nr:immunoglobulin light chain junction region [Macaca mulatta]